VTGQYCYHEYLRGKSWRGKLYRDYFLYPRLRRITGARFLDVGCGLGDFLAFGGSNAWGIDTNEMNVRYVTKKGLRCKQVGSDGRFPFRNEEFECVICDQVFEHISEPDKLLGEIMRVLMPKGKLVLGVPQEKGFRRDPDHKLFYNLESLKKLYSFAPGLRYHHHFFTPIPVGFLGTYLVFQSLYVCYTKVEG